MGLKHIKTLTRAVTVANQERVVNNMSVELNSSKNEFVNIPADRRTVDEPVRYVKNSDVPRHDDRRNKSYVEAVKNGCDDTNIWSPDGEISSRINMSE